MKENRKMNCPHCQATIDIDELLVAQFEQSIKQDLLQELKSREAELEHKKERYRKLEAKLVQEKGDREPRKFKG